MPRTARGAVTLAEERPRSRRRRRVAGLVTLALVAVLGTTPLDDLVPEADLVVPDLTHLSASVERGRVRVDRA